MDFIFMLTQDDRTVDDCLRVLDDVADLGIHHIGFKDIGVSPDVIDELNRRIKASGATSYLEVVSLAPGEARKAARRASEIGVDCLLGGTDIAGMQDEVAGTQIRFFPFVGRPEGHPTQLYGDAGLIAEDCRRSDAMGCAGIDLLAFRAVEAEPLDLIREARAALRGSLIVAGSIDSPGRIAEIAGLGVDAFTIGSALFTQRFAADRPSLRGQLAEVLAACG
jgi:hypothetical protein